VFLFRLRTVGQISQNNIVTDMYRHNDYDGNFLNITRQPRKQPVFYRSSAPKDRHVNMYLRSNFDYKGDCHKFKKVKPFPKEKTICPSYPKYSSPFYPKANNHPRPHNYSHSRSHNHLHRRPYNHSHSRHRVHVKPEEFLIEGDHFPCFSSIPDDSETIDSLVRTTELNSFASESLSLKSDELEPCFSEVVKDLDKRPKISKLCVCEGCEFKLNRKISQQRTLFSRGNEKVYRTYDQSALESELFHESCCDTEVLINLVFLLKLLKINIQLDLKQKSSPSDATRENAFLIANIIDKEESIITRCNKECLPVVYIIKCTGDKKGEKRKEKIVALDVDGKEYSLFHLIRCDSEYIPNLVTTKTYLTVVCELEKFFCLCLKLQKCELKKYTLSLKTAYSSLYNSINTVLNLIDVLLFQICQDTEKGQIGELVRSTAIQLFNYLVCDPQLIIYDSGKGEIISKYHQHNSNDSSFYGVQIYDLKGHLVKVGMSLIQASVYQCNYPLDLLTLKESDYITSNVGDLGNFVSYSNTLCQLKEYFLCLKGLLNDEICNICNTCNT